MFIDKAEAFGFSGPGMVWVRFTFSDGRVARLPADHPDARELERLNLAGDRLPNDLVERACAVTERPRAD